MAFNLFQKKTVVGVSISPEAGLEVAQIDYNNKVVLKYASQQLAYDIISRNIVDLDLFKQALSELLEELSIPKGSEIVLNLPPVAFKVSDYPASLNTEQVSGVIEEELMEHPLFKTDEPCFDAVALPNSTMQTHKIACTAAQKTTLIEIALQIKDLGYSLITIDSNVNSVINALMYNERINCDNDSNWLLLMVEPNVCRIIPMQGKNYVSYFEENVSIGEVLGDAENYSTVISAVNPIIKNLPAKFLYVVSNTNVISAKVLADKLDYSSPIIHQEANCYATEPFIELSSSVDESRAKFMSLGVIGAAINREFAEFSCANFNLFNKSLGDVYLMEQPPEISFAGKTWVLSLQNMLIASIIVVIPLCIIMGVSTTLLNQAKSIESSKLSSIKAKITDINKTLKENEQVSSKLFDEGDEIKLGVANNKSIYKYYTIVGTEIPQKVWLTRLNLGEKIIIEGQADNLESIYAFFRNIKDYNADSTSAVKLQKLALASTSKLTELTAEGDFDTDSILTSLNAEFYEFLISNESNTEKKTSTTKKNKPSPKGSNLPKVNL